MKLRYALLFLLLLTAASCQKSKSVNPPNPGNTSNNDTTVALPLDTNTVPSNVYIVGNEWLDSSAKLIYWNDGRTFIVDSVTAPSSGVEMVQPTSIFVSGSDVYIGGFSYKLGTSAYQVGKYWKNGVPVVLTDSANEGKVNSIFVSNNDVYAAGSQTGLVKNTVEYWKNGVPVLLMDTARAGDALSIFVSGTDVYVAGYDHLEDHPYDAAVYWKNGNRVVLSDAAIENAVATSIVVSANHVYVSGYTYAGTHTEAVYWKDGVRNVLSSNDSQVELANAIGVSGSDVYVAGKSGYVAKYWKNGSPVALTDGINEGNATSLCISNGDVYIAGYDYVTPKYWVNGVEHIIKNASLHEGGSAYGIFVK
jgi:hypothetical protein